MGIVVEGREEELVWEEVEDGSADQCRKRFFMGGSSVEGMEDIMIRGRGGCQRGVCVRRQCAIGGKDETHEGKEGRSLCSIWGGGAVTVVDRDGPVDYDDHDHGAM